MHSTSGLDEALDGAAEVECLQLVRLGQLPLGGQRSHHRLRPAGVQIGWLAGQVFNRIGPRIKKLNECLSNSSVQCIERYPSCEKLNPGFSLIAARVSWVLEAALAAMLPLESLRLEPTEGCRGGALRGAVDTSAKK